MYLPPVPILDQPLVSPQQGIVIKLRILQDVTRSLADDLTDLLDVGLGYSRHPVLRVHVPFPERRRLTHLSAHSHEEWSSTVVKIHPSRFRVNRDQPVTNRQRV